MLVRTPSSGVFTECVDDGDDDNDDDGDDDCDDDDDVRGSCHDFIQEPSGLRPKLLRS